jgi:murein DD-endopeptidase MepM/ murein hydrolase activator NlpD
LVLAAVLMFQMFGISPALAQDDFDLPDLDDYSGLQAITANSVDGVNVREEPGTESDILLSVPDGNIVDLRVDDTRTVTTADGIRWWPISIWGVDGWVAGMYLASVDGETSSDDTASDDETATDDESASDEEETAPASPNDGAWVAGDYVAATTDFLAMRAGPGTDESRIAWLGLGDVVQIVDGPFLNGETDWWLITDGAITAYVFGGYLTTASELDIDAPAAEETVTFAPGDTVIIELGSGGANIRDDATADGELMGTISEGVVLSVIDGPSYDADGAPWYLLDISEISDDSRGFVIGEALALSTEEVVAAVDEEAADEDEASGATGSFMYPIAEYRVTQGYGCTTFNFYPYNETLGCPWHNGVDLAAPLGTPMLASDSGTVKYAGWCDCALGIYIEIDHGNGYSTIYGHMNAVYVESGQVVGQQEVIGEVGTTGFSTGPHTHFMVKQGETVVNPFDYLPAPTG